MLKCTRGGFFVEKVGGRQVELPRQYYGVPTNSNHLGETGRPGGIVPTLTTLRQAGVLEGVLSTLTAERSSTYPDNVGQARALEGVERLV
jgi:hypothetical protein